MNKKALIMVVLGTLALSACDTMSPPVNDYNCYAHIMPIDRDYKDYAARCTSAHKGKSNEQYHELSINRLKACYYEKDEHKCQQLSLELNELISSWQEEPGAIKHYGYQVLDLKQPEK